MFYLINGINHDRFVGIAKDDGKAYDFYMLNVDGYRYPETEQEKAECLKKAQEYYNTCVPSVRTGTFSVSLAEITEDDIEEHCIQLELEDYLRSIYE